MAASGMARGESGWHSTTAATPAEASGAIMAEGSRPVSMPTTATLVPSTANSSVNASPSAAMPAALCAPSTSRRAGAQHLESPRHAHGGETFFHHFGGQRFAEERFGRGERHAAFTPGGHRAAG